MVKTRSQRKLQVDLGCQPKRTGRSQKQTISHGSDNEIESVDDTKTTTTGRVPKKRRRSRAATNTLGKKPSKCLDLLSAMPLDIIFEVASHLPPRGLVALSRTSEVLCRTLYSPSASSIWKAARSAVGAPDRSPGLSEPQWMSLIFGGPICQQCNTANVDKIDFSLRRRVCFDCKKQNMVPDVAFGELFPHYDTSIMDMVPYTQSGSWVLGGFKFFWKSDVERIASEWATLQKDIHISTKGAQAKAAAYRKQRIDEVEWITEHANVWDNWHHRFSVDEAYKKQKARDEAILERLLALGYDCRDYHYSDSEERIIHEDVEFTDQFWAHIQPKVVMLVESNRVRRLEQERADLRLERMRVLGPLYQEYVKSWAPTQWCYLPSVYELVNFPVVNDIVDADSSVSVSSSSFLPAIAQFPTLIPEWISAKKARITAMLDPPSPGPANNPLDLATSVFKCTGHLKTWCPKRALISWEAITAHPCGITNYFFPKESSDSTRLSVSRLGASTASRLVRAAGLDPSSTTAAEMDALDLRFACLDCAPHGPQLRSRKGYAWKSAVEHGMKEQYGKKKWHTKWYKMTLEEARRIKQNERDSPSHQFAWSCNHCAEYFNHWRYKEDVIQHLSDRHQITSPKEPSDLFWYPGIHRTLNWFNPASTEINCVRTRRSR